MAEPIPDGNVVPTRRPWDGKIPLLPEDKRLTGPQDYGAFVRASTVMLEAGGVVHCLQEGAVYVQLHDSAVKAFIQLNVANHVSSMLDGCTTAAAMWRKLKDAYLPQTSAQKMLLRNKLRCLQFNPKVGVDGLMAAVYDTYYQLRAIDTSADEDAVANNVAASLPPDFAPMVGAMLMGNGDKVLKLADLHATLMFVETHLRNTRTLSSERVLQVGAAVCWNCHTAGHIKRNCPKLWKPVAGGGVVPRPGETIIN